ncbi:MAG: histone deacetylase family protein [Promethearchaeota archaeon]
MLFIYSAKFDDGEYSSDPAASRDRFNSIASIMKEQDRVIEPMPATTADILRVHGQNHYEYVKRDSYLFEMASLSAGGSILAAESGWSSTPAFAAIRPPGHHASRNHAWGFCFFNNMAIALLKLVNDKKIKSAFILDFDLHVGDGTINILSNLDGFTIFNPDGANRKDYLAGIEDRFATERKYDILAVSAGFDQYINDWGNLLTTEDFKKIGKLASEFCDDKCQDRRFAILEGGYNFQDLGKNILSFCDGFD